VVEHLELLAPTTLVQKLVVVNLAPNLQAELYLVQVAEVLQVRLAREVMDRRDIMLQVVVVVVVVIMAVAVV
jgi:hypothetical protein